MVSAGWVAKRSVGVTGALIAGALIAGPAAGSISGVCPDGSIYIVQRAESIPCRDSKRVRPEEMPPLKPEMLPRPYGWEVFHRRNDPNNPYNLVETGDAARGGVAPGQTAQGADTRGIAESESGTGLEVASRNAPLPPVSSRPATPADARVLELAFGDDEVRDLALIIEYSQSRAPATLTRGGSSEAPKLVLRIAESRSFEARLQEAARRAGSALKGPVVLFSAVSAENEAFYANLTFVQDHLAFHPDIARSEELGLIDGRLGPLAPDGRVLGYVVLPEHMDLSLPIDIYWDDHQVTATLRP